MTSSRSIVTLAVLLSLLAACSRRPAFQGTPLDPPRDSLDFMLTDQFGQRLRLTELRGRVVVLTFLYTACPDLCPLVTQKIREVGRLLDDKRRDLAFLAVTVDPQRDTVPAIAEYSRRWGMLHRWRFLTGSERELEPIWRYYWVGEIRREAIGGAAAPATYDVQHLAPVHLIDRDGRVRVAYGSNFRPAELAHDIEALLTP